MEGRPESLNLSTPGIDDPRPAIRHILHLSRKDHAELEQAYSFLMQLRFLRQITAVETESAEPDNAVSINSLSRIERNLLKETFKRIETLQTRASFDFIGMSDAHMK